MGSAGLRPVIEESGCRNEYKRRLLPGREGMLWSPEILNVAEVAELL